jgi:predicted DNA-binding transcriptional regulator AlpA
MSDLLPLRPVAAPLARKRRRLSPLVVDARRLAKLLCVGIRTVRTWDASGKLPAPIRIGGRVVWRVSEIRAWLAAGAQRELARLGIRVSYGRPRSGRRARHARSASR